MSLPQITVPDSLPCFLATGHGIEEASVFAVVPMTQGHSRQRRRWTVPERVVPVSWLLVGETQIALADEFLDITLQACALPFSAQVANQGAGAALLYWHARWVAYPQFDMLPAKMARVSGALFLTGEGSESGPDVSELISHMTVALTAIPGTVYGPSSLTSHMVVALQTTAPLVSHMVVALEAGYAAGDVLREDGFRMLREDGDAILRED